MAKRGVLGLFVGSPSYSAHIHRGVSKGSNFFRFGSALYGWPFGSISEGDAIPKAVCNDRMPRVAWNILLGLPGTLSQDSHNQLQGYGGVSCCQVMV